MPKYAHFENVAEVAGINKGVLMNDPFSKDIPPVSVLKILWMDWTSYLKENVRLHQGISLKSKGKKFFELETMDLLARCYELLGWNEHYIKVTL